MPDATPENPARRLAGIETEIAQACKVARRSRDAIALIAVSKTRTANEIRPLIEAGHRRFGENRVQEAATKWPGLRAACADIELHLIGQLQSNKAEEAVALFDCIHSLDRMSLIEALSKAMAKAGKRVPCFVQVNIGEEEQKGGCAIADLPTLLAAAHAGGIEIVGLMCIPPADVEPAPYFALLAELAARHGLSQLSMGMSDDFTTAIMLGATHIRVGTALFGPRPVG
ncbi:MAG: YggS family pyridoxal phosphate-dependent enzyme [Sphingomonadales bacterium]|nr:YggS family pyridoxal phosphate-dependent enzyme [Sphingomonadales bacterium]